MSGAAFIIQKTNTTETLEARKLCMISGDHCVVSDINEVAHMLERLAFRMPGALAMPVGSVEFVQEVARVQGIEMPAPLECYPALARAGVLGRNVRKVRAGSLGLDDQPAFLKPVAVKTFSGFLWAPDGSYARDDVREKNPDYFDEQAAAFEALPPETPVWVSEPVTFVREDRYYILDGVVVGVGRYDDSEDDHARAPDTAVLIRAKQALERDGAPVAYGLDLGVLDTGETVVVEVNDAWALGLYRAYWGRKNPTAYLEMLNARWMQIAAQPVQAQRPKMRALV